MTRNDESGHGYGELSLQACLAYLEADLSEAKSLTNMWALKIYV